MNEPYEYMTIRKKTDAEILHDKIVEEIKALLQGRGADVTIKYFALQEVMDGIFWELEDRANPSNDE